ncbi:hypothetical protein [Lysobacter gummosus]|uniref:hypothetical protein n=1 Tax=Lysobacter gummosus TaxID=262324 RepID=UPI0036252CF0
MRDALNPAVVGSFHHLCARISRFSTSAIGARGLLWEGLQPRCFSISRLGSAQPERTTSGLKPLPQQTSQVRDRGCQVAPGNAT